MLKIKISYIKFTSDLNYIKWLTSQYMTVGNCFYMVATLTRLLELKYQIVWHHCHNINRVGKMLLIVDKQIQIIVNAFMLIYCFFDITHS